MEKVFFKEARPVWPVGMAEEMNVSTGFYGEFERPEDFTGKLTLFITGSSVYRVFLNGTFLCHGPARAAHGYTRVDELELPRELLCERNSLAVEAAGFCIESFYLIRQPSFLQAELRCGERVLLKTVSSETGKECVPEVVGVSETGDISDNGHLFCFQAALLIDRIRKVQRYSYQRVFLEAYRMDAQYADWRRKGFSKERQVLLEEGRPYRLLERHVPYCTYPVKETEKILEKGSFFIREDAPRWEDRSYLGISEQYKGFPPEELELLVSAELDRIAREKVFPDSTRMDVGQFPVTLSAGQYALASYEYNMTGFLGAELECSEDAQLVYVFDEILNGEGDITYNRCCCVNAVWYELKKGRYCLETLQPYTQKYGKWLVLKGNVKIQRMWVREYTNPEAEKGVFSCSDPVINAICEAGRRTFAQNAVDLYMDCPSRERAGWLCDSFFTGRVEYVLTGNTAVEDNFLENYLLAPEENGIPEGMLPMCYPADHPLGEYIPNWALWLILELWEYRNRKPDEMLTAAFSLKIQRLFQYFETYENEDGLLENLDGWVFVEWSAANELTAGVNYPSNMLYSAALRAAGRLYEREDWLDKGRKLAEKIRSQSYKNGFFSDQALRRDGKLVLTKQRTEVCQYYAYFMKIADRETYPELFETLAQDFGPKREKTKKWAEIAPANAFIGNYLRIELLSLAGRKEQVLQETKDFFGYMVQRTGTLWENTKASASCNHGFASHVIYVWKNMEEI